MSQDTDTNKSSCHQCGGSLSVYCDRDYQKTSPARVICACAKDRLAALERRLAELEAKLVAQHDVG